MNLRKLLSAAVLPASILALPAMSWSQVAAPQVPEKCKTIWAPYAALRGVPLKPGLYRQLNFQWPGATFTLTITSVGKGVVVARDEYRGARGVGGGDITANLIGNDTMTWKNWAGSTLVLRAYDDALVGFINSDFSLTCSPIRAEPMKNN